MDFENLTRAMNELGVPVNPATQTAFIRFVQRVEGHEPCFRSGHAECPNTACAWRTACLTAAGDRRAPPEPATARRNGALMRFGGLVA